MYILFLGGDCLSKIEIETRIMQENLCELRKIAGWTAEDLANKLDITKQTISNIENCKVQMTRIQYIAIRSVFECEIYKNKKNTTLKKVINILFDLLPMVYDQKNSMTRTAIISIASAAAAGISQIELHSVATTLLSTLGYVCHAAAPPNREPTLDWLIDSI